MGIPLKDMKPNPKISKFFDEPMRRGKKKKKAKK